MANKKEREIPQSETAVSVEKSKVVKNRGNGKVELLIDGKVVVILPKMSVEVPSDFDVPQGIGLYVK